MPLAPDIQKLINRNIITAQQANQFALRLSATTVKALGTEELARKLHNLGMTLSNEQLEVILAMKPRYVRRAMHSLRVINLVLKDLLTVAMIQMINLHELVEYLFNHSVERSFQNGNVTPEFFGYIADPLLYIIVTNPGIKDLMLRGLPFGVSELKNLRLLINEVGFDQVDIYRLMRNPENILWYVYNTDQCEFLARLINNQIMPKEFFVNADVSVVKALQNRWFRYLLESGKMTFAEFQGCLDEYIGAYVRNDPLKNSRMTNELVRSKLRDYIKPTVSDIKNIIGTFTGFQEFLTRFPNNRDEFIMTLLCSNLLFNKFITTNTNYATLRTFFSANLPEVFQQITRTTTLADARQARLQFYYEINTCLADLRLDRGWNGRQSPVLDNLFDHLPLIAPQAARHDQGHGNAQSLFGLSLRRAYTAPAPTAYEDSNPPRPE